MKNKIFASLLLASMIFTAQSCGNKQTKSEEQQQEQEAQKVFLLDKDSLTLNVDDDYVLGYTLENITGSIKWSSSNSSVVGISGNKLIAKNEGSAVIKAEVGGIARECNVTVLSEGNGQYFIESSKAFNVEINSDGLIPEFHYFFIKDGKKNEITNQTPRYEVKDEAIAKIENGKIVPISVGQTTIKVQYEKASSEIILNVCNKIISNVNQFKNMVISKEGGSFFALANDIDFTNQPYDPYSTGNDLTSYSSCFKGTFEGNGFTIKGISITGKKQNHSIFGCLYNAHIKDVNFENITLNNQGAESMAVLANGITGDDCEIKNVKVSCVIKGSNEGNLNLISSKYLENKFMNYSNATEWSYKSFGASKITNVVFDAKFDSDETMGEANVKVLAPEITQKGNFYPECSNVLVYAPGAVDEHINGVTVFDSKLDLIWNVHNNKCLPDANWDYSEEFSIPSLSNASSTSGFVYSQSEMTEIDPEYAPIKVELNGAETTLFPYGSHVEGYVYGDHPTKASKEAVFVNQRWSSYGQNPTVAPADLDISQYKKVCFFVRTKTFDKSFITIKDLSTGRDYSTTMYDCEISSKWVKVEMVKKSEGLWTVYIGDSKINFDYPATYFKEIPIRFNDVRYYYSEMLGVKDPNVVPKQWVNLGVLAKNPNGSALPTTNSVICSSVSSLSSSIIEGAGAKDLAKINSQDLTQASEFKFYARSAAKDDNYFIVSLNGSDTINNVDHTPTQGLVSFKATSTEWTCFKFVVIGQKIEIYRDDTLLTDQINADLDDFGIQLSGGRFYVTEMFCYK